FSDKPALQRKLIVLAEEHGLSKRIFELVIELHLAKKPYAHLLNESISPVERARLKAQKERQRVLKNGRRDDGDVWIQYAREQESAWRDLTKELEAASSANRKERSSYRRARTSGVVARRSAATPAARALT
ncbi:MAG: hypothetical protein OXT06_28450, partial [Rhodospirillaceae bacterium]|nr:hypothetical protein [Rhodospirillaceae bacterium]